METDRRVDLTWSAAVWKEPAGEADFPTELLGSATLVTERVLVTCAHVCKFADGDSGIVLTFPLSDRSGEVFCLSKPPETAGEPFDIASLELARDAPVPPAPLHLGELDASDFGQNWTTHGYPGNDTRVDGSHRATGYPVRGQIKVAGGGGHLLLETSRGSERKVVSGFSGSGVWSYARQAVVAVIDTSDQESRDLDVTALTLRQAMSSLPGLKDALGRGRPQSSDAARQVWNLADDPALDSHWRPRARGGTTALTAEGDRFKGRRAALTEISDWLADPASSSVLVVTGSPGSGKSAVVARAVTTSDPVLSLGPEFRDSVVFPEGFVNVAVHAADKSPEEVAGLIARGMGIGVPDDLRRLGSRIAQGWIGPEPAFTVAIDAVDEAIDPQRLLNQIVRPLQAAGNDNVKMRVLLGSRRTDPSGVSLLAPLRELASVIDLDEPRHAEPGAMVDYILSIIRGDGDDSPNAHYQDDVAAGPIAERIAEIAQQNFLVASLIAHPRRDDLEPIDPATITDTPDVATALAEYLGQLPQDSAIGDVDARAVLSALAFAQAPGWTADLWSIAARGLFQKRVLMPDALITFAADPAINYLLESTGSGTSRSYMLRHESLSEVLLEDYA